MRTSVLKLFMNGQQIRCFCSWCDVLLMFSWPFHEVGFCCININSLFNRVEIADCVFKWHLFLLVEQHSAFHRSLYLAHGPSKPWELRSAIRSFAVGPQIMSSLLCTSACDFCSSADSVIRVILEHRLTLSLGAFCNHRSLHLSKRSCMFCQQSVKSKESITLFIFSCDSCIPIQVFCPLRQELWVCGLS